MTTLKGRTLFISGASRGIGLAIALRAARDGANIAIAAKTAEPHPKLEGTIYTAAKEIEAAGGKALPLICDIREEAQVEAAVNETVKTFGGIDICVNNASAHIAHARHADRHEALRPDARHQRARHVPGLAQLHPASQEGHQPAHPHALPAARHEPEVVRPARRLLDGQVQHEHHRAGPVRRAEERGIAANTLWPRTTIATAAIRNLLGGDELMRRSRSPEIMGDAAHIILTKDAKTFTGNFCIDDTLLYEHGVTDFEKYRVDKSVDLAPDFFVPDTYKAPPGVETRGPDALILSSRGLSPGSISQLAPAPIDSWIPATSAGMT